MFLVVVVLRGFDVNVPEAIKDLTNILAFPYLKWNSNFVITQSIVMR